MSVDTEPGRPSPEALLAAQESGRGRLKIFLGAAPGVGKTYEMLTAARARRRDGVDVVVGIVETHGRTETAALLEGLEMIPRRVIDYNGRTLDEMDLDAILARHPQLVLVDELAHTNAPGSRHPKRHLDVAEILDAGIDVFTTLNVQHVESLNDVVAQITRIRVRETVPDSILDRADDIEVIDLSPADLIQRLNEGKVYVPHQAERALKHYFSPGNLTALRELALRRAADRVDEQLLAHMRAHAIAGPWPAGERILACISEDPRSPALLRYAKRLADRLHAPWTAVHVESARSHRLSEAERDRVAEALRLAEQLGGEALTIPGSGRIADDLLAHARANNVTQIVIGKSNRPRWFELVNGSVVHELIRGAGAISIHVMAGREAEAAPQPPPVDLASALRRFDARSALIAAGAVAAALAISYFAYPFIGIESVDLIFLLAIVGVASTLGLVASLAASVLASVGYDYFFLPPLYTFTVTDPINLSALAFFLIVAVIVSNLAARMRIQITTARSRARTTEALYAFSRKLAAIVTLDDLLWAAAYQIAAAIRVDVVLLLPDDGRLTVRVGYPPEDEIDDGDIGAAKWAFETNQPAGHGSATLTGAKRLFLPLRTGSGPVGVVGISRRPGSFRLTPDEKRLIDALMDQTAVAITRISLAAEMDRTRLEAESERLRSALLTSLSHDLKTPLASIIGAAGELRRDGTYDPATRAELAGTIESEAERLNRFVANLLDMTRLESGPIALHLEAADIGEIVGTAVGRSERQLAGHKVAIDIASGLPLLRLDAVLFEQVLVNLLDNAARYAPRGTTVTIAARQSGDALIVTVADEGPGIPAADLPHVFEKFYRAGGQDGGHDGRPAGTGLGLSICRGFVAAMGGTITAANRDAGPGTVFTIAFPAAVFAAAVPPEAFG